MIAPESAYPKTDFPHSTIWFRDSIFMIRFKPELIIDYDLALQMEKDWCFANKGQSVRIFVDLNDMIYIDPRARKLWAAGCLKGETNSIAIYTDDKLLQVIGKAFILLDSPTFQAEVFYNPQTAIDWLIMH